MERFSQKLLVGGFLLLLFGLLLAHLLLPDAEFSYSERRRLAEAPELTLASVRDGSFFQDAETYLLDHFPLRDTFRTGKALYSYGVLRTLDNNGIYLLSGAAYKLEYPLNERQVAYAAALFERICTSLLTANNRTFWAVIPDKNYFVTAQNGYPSMDYERLYAVMRETLATPEEIPLADLLDETDYYRTDLHWRQERLFPVAARIAEALGVTIDGEAAYRPHSFGTFHGAYYGQAALPLAPDELTYLTSAVTDGCAVTSIESTGTTGVYTPEAYDGMDAYDVFLSGATALLTVENPHAATDRELILFRDSFGSSLAPLLLSGYRRVTLVDLRYIASSELEKYITFDDQDVLFLYSTQILNSGAMLR